MRARSNRCWSFFAEAACAWCSAAAALLATLLTACSSLRQPANAKESSKITALQAWYFFKKVTEFSISISDEKAHFPAHTAARLARKATVPSALSCVAQH